MKIMNDEYFAHISNIVLQKVVLLFKAQLYVENHGCKEMILLLQNGSILFPRCPRRGGPQQVLQQHYFK